MIEEMSREVSKQTWALTDCQTGSHNVRALKRTQQQSHDEHSVTTLHVKGALALFPCFLKASEEETGATSLIDTPLKVHPICALLLFLFWAGPGWQPHVCLCFTHTPTFYTTYINIVELHPPRPLPESVVALEPGHDNRCLSFTETLFLAITQWVL